ncbi:uncharacterized protein LOC143277414 [Babylonia areolata]|uniref:uncharacterized protein LOC143277414 n=1 Tax=Babylonia areolata TaxID=304850 RepID=UPI003FCF6AD7
MVTKVVMVVWPLADLSTILLLPAPQTATDNLTSSSNATITPVVISVPNVTLTANVTSAFDDTSSLLTNDITRTLLDLKVLGAVRSCLWGLWVSVLFASQKGETRMRNVVFYVILMAMLMTWMYNSAKVLLFSERSEVLNDWCHKASLAWTGMACIVTSGLLLWSRHVQDVKHAGSKDKGSLLIPMYTGQLIDSLLVTPPLHSTGHTVLRLTLVAACRLVCTWLHKWMFSMYVARITLRLRYQFFASVMAQAVPFFDEHDTGELVSRLLTDVAVIGDSLSPSLELCLRDIFCAAGAMVLTVRTSWQLSLLTLTFLPAFVAVSFFYGVVMKWIGTSSQEMMADIGDKAKEAMANVRTVRSFAMETHEVSRLHVLLARLYGNGWLETWVHSSFQSLSMLVYSALELCSLVYGCHIVQRHFLSGGDLVTVIIYLSLINSNVQEINSMYACLLKGLGASQVVFQHISTAPPSDPSGEGAVSKDRFQGEIEFRDVCFTYLSRPQQPVLNNMSFKVARGEVVALVGPSGGGKSTCMSLLQNFYRPSSGQVLLDGVPVHRYRHRCLHSQMALVGQEPALFSCSIRDNICYGLEACAEERLTYAARQANAHDFICRMADGYDTTAGENGFQLSGGQKQRVAIARALVRQPAVLLLDEATSALDSQSEALVQEALFRSARGRTVLIIAHRLSTVQQADRVLVIHRGHVVEEGTPSDLLARGGLFTSLAEKQLLRTTTPGDSGLLLLPPRTSK